MLTNLCQTSILSANSHGDLDVVYLKTAACMTLASLKDRFVSMPPGKMFTTRLLAAPLTRCMWAEPHFCYCCCYATPTMENQFGRSDDWWSPHLCWTYVMLEAKESELRTSWTFYLLVVGFLWDFWFAVWGPTLGRQHLNELKDEVCPTVVSFGWKNELADTSHWNEFALHGDLKYRLEPMHSGRATLCSLDI